MDSKKANLNSSNLTHDNINFGSNDKFMERQRIEEELEKNATLLIQHQKMQRIDSFTGYFEFMHNNFLTPVYFEGSLYPSVTHAYHAARSTDEVTRKAILNADTFQTVAKIARRIEDPENWQMKRLKVMEKLVRDKFRRSKELQEKLKATSPRVLIMTYEDDTPGNLFWGMAKNKGQNRLGRILMKIREDIINSTEVVNWITTNFDLITDYQFLPEISLTVNKNNTQIEHTVLKNKPFYKFGQLPDSDVILAHPTISRLHAAIICDQNLGVVLVDLRSKAGTKLDNDVLKDHIPYRLKDGKKINFALSTRDYIVAIDLSKIKKVYERERSKHEGNIQLLNQLSDTTKKEEVIKKALNLEANEESDTIFLNHIPPEAVEKEFVSLLEEHFGEVKNVYWPNDRETGFKKSYAFIQFKNIESAKEAVDYGIIGYEINADENEDFEVVNAAKRRSVMLNIKYADKDRFRPRFGGDDWRKGKFNKDLERKGGERKDKEPKSRSKRESRRESKKEYTRSGKDKKYSTRSKYRDHKKSRRSRSKSSSSESESESSDYYSDSDSRSDKSSESESSSESNSSSSSTEKVQVAKPMKYRSRSRSRSYHRRRK